MSKEVKEYFQTLKGLFGKIIATNSKGKVYPFDKAIDLAIDIIIGKSASGGRLLFIGNGASAAISSHIATDFWKNAGIRAIAFNDASGLTCISNDFGYKHVFEKPLEMFALPQDILFAISSSGRSKNILYAVKAARKKKLTVITLSGFDSNNPLRKLGGINFYVPSSSYGFVEVTHHSICHSLIDIIIGKK